MISMDVVIIGAGVSGLTIAMKLLNAGKSFIILDANGHIGGRCWAKNDIDLGASWVHRCDSVKKVRDIADIDMCKQTSCDSYIDPDTDVIMGVPTEVLKEYARLYRKFVKSNKHATATYTGLAAYLSTQPNAMLLNQVLTYHRAKMNFHEPQLNTIETRAYTQDGWPNKSMYATFVEPLMARLKPYIRLRTPVQSVRRVDSKFVVQTSRSEYICREVVYTGTFPALHNIALGPNIIPKKLREFMNKTTYLQALKVAWYVDERSEAMLRELFKTRRQLHVPGLPWTVMLHEKEGCLYTYTAGPMYQKAMTQSVRQWKADLCNALGIHVLDHMLYDFNKNKYIQTSYTSLFPDNDPQIQERLMNPSRGFYMSGDSIVLSKSFDRWEWCMGTVTGAIRTSEYVARTMLENPKRSSLQK